jgi:hypothetical protein
MKKILCWVGFHSWLYLELGNYEGRICMECDKQERHIVFDTLDYWQDVEE